MKVNWLNLPLNRFVGQVKNGILRFPNHVNEENDFMECISCEIEFFRSVSRFVTEEESDIIFIPIFNARFMYSNEIECIRYWNVFVTPNLNPNKKYFTLYAYCLCGFNVNFIPKNVTVLSYENLVTRTVIDRFPIDLGCYDRMMVIPYIMSQQRYNRHADTKFVEQTAPIKISYESWVKRPYELIFVGTRNVEYSPLLKARDKIVNELEESIGLKAFSQSIVNPDNAYQQSRYALVWRGSTPTRRAFYQAIANGCIPIIPSIAAKMYKTLFSKSDGSSCSPIDLQNLIIVTDDYSPNNIQQLIDEHKKLEMTLVLNNIYQCAKMCDYYDTHMIQQCLSSLSEN